MKEPKDGDVEILTEEQFFDELRACIGMPKCDHVWITQRKMDRTRSTPFCEKCGIVSQKWSKK